ncbi:hypothetical protein BXZ70DRAFT_781022 [Cristinia sonorae]|uniref:Secreted protein n=1 Tax=Cristinia sonorae TaxID=1940300 RepID=A0A8K0XRZ5_9AGAR|nr:hypothetical protein BXZ70DRAFT_781022 [Cristinia sonorae]
MRHHSSNLALRVLCFLHAVRQTNPGQIHTMSQETTIKTRPNSAARYSDLSQTRALRPSPCPSLSGLPHRFTSEHCSC